MVRYDKNPWYSSTMGYNFVMYAIYATSLTNLTLIPLDWDVDSI